MPIEVSNLIFKPPMKKEGEGNHLPMPEPKLASSYTDGKSELEHRVASSSLA